MSEQSSDLMVSWRDTVSPYPNRATVHSLFEMQVDTTPDATAIQTNKSSITYAELNRRANQLTRVLRRNGVAPETPVAICFRRSIEMVVAALAVLKCGGAYVPLDPEYPTERLAYMLRDSAAKVLLIEQSVPVFESFGLPTIYTDRQSAEVEEQPVDNLPAIGGPDDLAYIVYTSGSSGVPKGVCIPHRGIVRLVKNTNHIRFTSSDVIAQISKFSFDASVWEIWGALLAGAQLAIFESEELQSAESFRLALNRYGITSILVITALFNQIAKQDPAAFVGVQNVFFGGEAADPRCVRDVLEHSKPDRLVNLYGPAESTTLSTWHEVTDVAPDASSLPLGKFISNTHVFLLDDKMRPVPAGVAGEIYIGGDGLARCYAGRPRETASVFLPNPYGSPGSRMYKTGDLGRYLPNGDIEFLGRADTQIKIRGFRVEPGEIEATLRRHASIDEAVVVARRTAARSDQLVAHFTVRGGHEIPSPRDLRLFVSQTLPAFMLPSLFVMRESFPLSPNGKIDRKAVANAPLSERASSDSASFSPPRDDREMTLTRIWSEVLNLPQVGVFDNFFELGGDSLLSMQIVSRAGEQGLHINPKDLLACQTIAELAERIKDSRPAKADQSIVVGRSPLSPSQLWHFDVNARYPDQYNMLVRLDAVSTVDHKALGRAVEHLFVHHDALRMRFEICGDSVVQFNRGLDAVETLEVVDLSSMDDWEYEPALETLAATLHDSLSAADGPLIRFVLVTFGTKKFPHLLVVTHHLVADAISFRTLLHDLAISYGQAERGETIRLPSKTNSFRDWAARFREYVQSGQLDSELPYWLEQVSFNNRSIPYDFRSDGVDTEVNTRKVTVTLTSAETERLVRELPKGKKGRLQDILLTLLAKTLSGWGESTPSVIDLSVHGLETFGTTLDISRTVGWFSTLAPFFLNPGPSDSFDAQVRVIQARLNQIPNGGVGYQALRYMRDIDATAPLRTSQNRQICFAYLGQFEETIDRSFPFRFKLDPAVPSRHPANPRSFGLEIMTGIRENRFEIECSYSRARHRRTTIESLMESFAAEIRAVL